jgi:xylan 1,4-beta-xylosidase
MKIKLLDFSAIACIVFIIFANQDFSYLKSKSGSKAETIYLADPTIFVDKETYYLYGTNSSNGFMVYSSKDLKDWRVPAEAKNGLALTKGDSYGTEGFWAPQVFKYKEDYFMAYTADENIAIAKSKSPTGPFKQTFASKISGAHKQIDPYVFIDKDGSKYLYHVELAKGNRIFVAKLKDDFSDIIPGTEKECISETEHWENTAKSKWAVTEGPTVLMHKNVYYMFYSANDFRNIDYAVGYAVADNPLGPWKKYAGNPIISRANMGTNGTGHGDFFTDKKGEMFYVFHTHNSSSEVSPRLTAIVNARFKADALKQDKMEIYPETFRLLLKTSD